MQGENCCQGTAGAEDWEIRGQGPNHLEPLSQNQNIRLSIADGVPLAFETMAVISTTRKRYWMFSKRLEILL